MSALSIQVPFPVFQDRDGQPLENGYVWIGEPNLNPQTNPVVAYYDSALTIPAAQPLRTLNGYVSRAGAPAQIYVDGVNFSILVQDSKGSMVYNFPDGTGISPDAAGIEYDPPFTGAVTSGYTVQDKLSQYVSVKDFGADPTGAANASVAFIAALAASSAVYVPPGTYRFDATVTVPANKKLFGSNRQSTTLLHNFNGNMFILSDGATLEGMTIDGNGATYTGQGVTCTGTNGKQLIQDCSIIDFAAACIYFESLAGSQSTVNNVLAYQTNGTSGSNNFAIVIQDTGSPVAQAVPRKFSQIESNGFCSFFFGSTNNVYITSSFLGDLLYTINSTAVFISNCRIANQAALTINGTTHIINGSDIAPQITLGTTVGGAAANTLTLTGNVYNNPPVVDNFGTANIIEQQLSSYTCTLSAGGSPASLGNGTLAASFARTGSATYVSIALTLGSTTSLGTGQISFSLPYQVRGANHVGTVRMVAGGVNFTGVCTASFGNNTVALVRDTSGAVTFNSPGVFTTGDVIQISIVYT
jgi:hypothetical protein